jgi:hypothetical protein
VTLAPASHAEAARAEAEAAAAVAVARRALYDAHLAVLNARLARIDAGEEEPDAATVDGHTPLAGRNAVSRHGPALAHGLRGEIHYILTRKPRSVVKSLLLPIRDEPVLHRRRDDTLKQFVIAFTVSYLIGYLVNLMQLWRVFAAQQLAERLGGFVIPVILVILSSVAMWFLLTVFAMALAQQPKIRRALLREIADYGSNAEAQAYAGEAAAGR